MARERRMTTMGRLAGIHLYPVKSMGGERLTEATVTTRGLDGDRVWAVVAGDGRLGSGKSSHRFVRIDGLRACTAVRDGAAPVVTLPDGEVVRGDDPGADERLSAALGQPVRLVPEAGEPHFDAGPEHLCTTAALAALGRAAGLGRVDALRFRPNLVVDGGPEVERPGTRLRIGTVELAVTRPTERCVMVNAATAELPEDGRVLRAVAATSDLCHGVYADVTRPGVLRVGDAVVRLGRP
jgi:uncharacterized protein YcbX